MNKNLHRVIFNKARGIRMVVQETASSEGKASNGSTQTGAADSGDLSAGRLRTAKSFLSDFPLSAAARTAGVLALALGFLPVLRKSLLTPRPPIASAPRFWNQPTARPRSTSRPLLQVASAATPISSSTSGTRAPSSTTAAPMCKPRLVAGCKAIHGLPMAAPESLSMKSTQRRKRA